LDGLDEIPEEVRGPAISRINDALRPGEQVILTCRSKQYKDVIRPAGGVEVTLRGAAGIHIRPLDADAVRGYLCDDAAGPVGRARWDPVLTALGTEAPAGQVLRTPLMVGLARAIYNPRPGELVGEMRDPAELCKPDLADPEAVESLLFDAFVPAAYRHDPADRWKAQDVEHWLVFLARHLELRIGSPDLAWWQLPVAVPGFGLAFGVVSGILIGLTLGVLGGIVSGVTQGVVGGAVGGVVLGTVWGNRIRVGGSPKPVRGIGWRAPSRSVFMVTFFGVFAVVILGLITSGTAAWDVATAAFVVAGGLMLWAADQKGALLDISSAASPSAVLASDRKTGIAVGAIAGIAAGSLIGIYVGIRNGVASGVVVGALALLPAGIAASFTDAAWPSYEIATIWLALRHRLPWQLMGFLSDAHQRGVLRQAGAIYQFRHIELQRRLATRPGKSDTVPETAGSGSVAAPEALSNDAST
jgi:hypothetical protein